MDVYDDKAGVSAKEGYRIISEAEMDIEKMVSVLEKNKEWNGVIYLCGNPDEAWHRFTGRFTIIEAAGGLVCNPENKYLVIFRRGRWDLPKGKIDYDEGPKEAAVREVGEECGVTDLRITDELPATFHTFPQNGKRILKKTHWFLMNSDGKEKLVPQTEEHIEEAIWMDEKTIREKVFANTFRSVRIMLTRYFNKG